MAEPPDGEAKQIDAGLVYAEPAPVIVTAIAVCCACDAGLIAADDLAFVSRKGETLCPSCAWWLRHGGGLPAPWMKVASDAVSTLP